MEFNALIPEITVKNIDVSNNYKLYEDITEACYMVNDYPHKQREFLVQDPDGYLLRFCQAA